MTYKCDKMENSPNIAPFYIGQKVVASKYAESLGPGCRIKKGFTYVITGCHFSINPANGTGPYWYVGYDGSAPYLSPKLFSPYQEMRFPSLTFEQIKKYEVKEVIGLN